MEYMLQQCYKKIKITVPQDAVKCCRDTGGIFDAMQDKDICGFL